MSLSEDMVRSIAELAKLELNDGEASMYAEQLSAILEYFESLQQVDTSQVEATASVLPLKNILRPDAAEPPLSPVDAIANAPDSDDNQFRVSAILDE